MIPGRGVTLYLCLSHFWKGLSLFMNWEHLEKRRREGIRGKVKRDLAACFKICHVSGNIATKTMSVSLASTKCQVI